MPVFKEQGNGRSLTVSEKDIANLREFKGLSEDTRRSLNSIQDSLEVSKETYEEIAESLEDIRDIWDGSLQELTNLGTVLKDFTGLGSNSLNLQRNSTNLARQLTSEMQKQYAMRSTGEGISQKAVSARIKAVEGLKYSLDTLKQSAKNVAESLNVALNVDELDLNRTLQEIRTGINSTLDPERIRDYRNLRQTVLMIDAATTSVDALNDSTRELVNSVEAANRVIGPTNGRLDTYIRLIRRAGLGGIADQISQTKANATAAFHSEYARTRDPKKAEEAYKNVLGDLTDASGIVRTLTASFSALTVALGYFAAVFANLLKFDEEAVKTKRIIGQWADASALANTSFVTGLEVLKTMRDLGEQFHINPVQVFSPQELGRISQAQKLTGMTSEAAGNLAVQSKIIGLNANTYRDEIAKGANRANALNHSAVNLSSVQNDVLRTSRAIALSYGQNVVSLARAASTAASLGMNLQDVENIAKNLMQFESSIEAEMQAQLLTGMQLNLARARELALNNDLEGVAREISNQGMNAANFSRMNYIQQENMAKALGMSREQMAKMLIMQEINKGLTSEQVAAMTGMSRKSIEAISAQEKWKTAMQQALEIFVPLLEPVLQVVSSIFRLASPILGILSTIAGWISRIANWVSESNMVVRTLSAVVLTALGIAIFRGGVLKSIFSGTLSIVTNIGKSIAGWVSGLGNVGSTFDSRVGRWRNRETGRFTAKPFKFNTKDMLQGSVAMLAMAGALFITAKAAREFENVGWDSLAKAGLTLGALVAAVTVAGKTLTAAGPSIMTGAGYIAGFGLAVGVALIGIAGALRVAAPAFDAIANIVVALGTAIKTAFEGVATLVVAVFGGITNLLSVITFEKAAALTAVGGGFAALALGVGAASLALATFPAAKLARVLSMVPNQTQSRVQNLGESEGISKENISATAQEIVIKQAEVQASSQQISIEQKAADLSRIERKMDELGRVIRESRPDWNWLEFGQETGRQIPWMFAQ